MSIEPIRLAKVNPMFYKIKINKQITEITDKEISVKMSVDFFNTLIISKLKTILEKNK